MGRTKFEELQAKVEIARQALKDAEQAVKAHQAKTIFAQCPECKKKTAIGTLTYIQCIQYNYLEGNWEDGRGMTTCPKCGALISFGWDGPCVEHKWRFKEIVKQKTDSLGRWE